MLKVNNVELPTPQSVDYSYNKIWSENTGRLDNGYFVGDLVCVKRKYEVTFPPLTTAQLTLVRNACAAQFAEIVITDVDGGDATLWVYFGDVTVSAYSWHNGIRYAINCRVSMIER